MTLNSHGDDISLDPWKDADSGIAEVEDARKKPVRLKVP
jgi:hypothetical protein